MPGALKVAVQMDPMETVKIDADSTFALMLEAQTRGHQLWHYEVRHMALRGQRLTARANPVVLRREVGNHFTFGATERLDLGTMDVVLMRQDPPFDMAYITATHMLEHIHPKTLVSERPGRRPQRAREAAGRALPRSDAADAHHLGPRRHRRVPGGVSRHHHQAAVRQWRHRGLPRPRG